MIIATSGSAASGARITAFAATAIASSIISNVLLVVVNVVPQRARASSGIGT